ncbi:hypothetical protein [Vacuolonema iberomarrocanum]|uniref:hypothetical protein n=1 Tax=Vacuolonema iberomarrocanum TaxID=3454632 RepID=UPI0019F3402A|nr:hypothetical protein [filamentous cyanobacterium LEGE 07170]
MDELFRKGAPLPEKTHILHQQRRLLGCLAERQEVPIWLMVWSRRGHTINEFPQDYASFASVLSETYC